jgi:ketosteroid isomerase-like protein
MDGVLAHHTDDVVLFDVPPPAQRKGRAAYEDSWELFFNYSPGGEGAFDLLDLQIAAGDTVAFGHALVRIFDNRVRLTLGLRKIDGEWLIAHEHHSYPSE